MKKSRNHREIRGIVCAWEGRREERNRLIAVWHSTTVQRHVPGINKKKRNWCGVSLLSSIYFLLDVHQSPLCECTHVALSVCHCSWRVGWPCHPSWGRFWQVQPPTRLHLWPFPTWARTALLLFETHCSLTSVQGKQQDELEFVEMTTVDGFRINPMDTIEVVWAHGRNKAHRNSQLSPQDPSWSSKTISLGRVNKKGLFFGVSKFFVWFFFVVGFLIFFLLYERRRSWWSFLMPHWAQVYRENFEDRYSNLLLRAGLHKHGLVYATFTIGTYQLSISTFYHLFAPCVI